MASYILSVVMREQEWPPGDKHLRACWWSGPVDTSPCLGVSGVSAMEIIFLLKQDLLPLLQGPTLNFSASLRHYFQHPFNEEKIVQDPTFIPP